MLRRKRRAPPQTPAREHRVPLQKTQLSCRRETSGSTMRNSKSSDTPQNAWDATQSSKARQSECTAEPVECASRQLSEPRTLRLRRLQGAMSGTSGGQKQKPRQQKPTVVLAEGGMMMMKCLNCLKSMNRQTTRPRTRSISTLPSTQTMMTCRSKKPRKAPPPETSPPVQREGCGPLALPNMPHDSGSQKLMKTTCRSTMKTPPRNAGDSGNCAPEVS